MRRTRGGEPGLRVPGGGYGCRDMRETRHQFREDLRTLEQQALGGLDMVIEALDRALRSISSQDIELAGMVIADDDRIDGRYLEVHQGLLSMLALQAPVATDLRIIAALLLYGRLAPVRLRLRLWFTDRRLRALAAPDPRTDDTRTERR